MCLDGSPTRWCRATCCGAFYCAFHDEGDEAIQNRRWTITKGCPSCRAKPTFELFLYSHDEFSLIGTTRDDANEFNMIRIKLDERSSRRVMKSLRRDNDGQDFAETTMDVVTIFLFKRRHENTLAEELVGRTSTTVPTVRAVTDVSGYPAIDVIVSDEITNRVILYSAKCLNEFY